MPKTPKLSPIGKLCHKAADLIKQKGWCRYKLEDARGRHCIIGAINAARSGDSMDWGRNEAAHSTALALGFTGMFDMVDWNNYRVKRKSQVLARLRSVS